MGLDMTLSFLWATDGVCLCGGLAFSERCQMLWRQSEQFLAHFAKALRPTPRPPWCSLLTTTPLLAASLARRLYCRQGTGVGGFAKVYGDKQPRGQCPGRFKTASRGLIRSCLQQLEKVLSAPDAPIDVFLTAFPALDVFLAAFPVVGWELLRCCCLPDLGDSV